MNPTQPAKFRPLSERERHAVVQKINAVELAELRAELKTFITPPVSEGTRSVHTIHEHLRTGAIRLQPQPEIVKPSLTQDPYRLHDGIPVLRVVAGERRAHVAGNTAPRPRANPMPIPANPQPIEQVELPSRPPIMLAEWALVALALITIVLIAFNIVPVAIALAKLGF